MIIIITTIIIIPGWNFFPDSLVSTKAKTRIKDCSRKELLSWSEIWTGILLRMEILRDAIDDRRRFVLLGPTGLPHCRILHVFLLVKKRTR